MSTLDKLMTAFLALLFGFAGIDKLWHASGFVTAINSYRLLPFPMGSFLAPPIIAAELTIAVGLLLPSWRRRAALQGAILMGIFTIGLLGNRLLGQEGICGCWFSVSMAQGDIHFAFNAILIAMSLIVWHASAARADRPPLAPRVC